ncbi:OmpW/AlkL family protein [Acinetobacter modestus]|uniref:OmpW/AlkL family protein n=1 Tax=Acinetobacter modestus TaxID=1776740 RepID=UPI00301B31AB
MKKRMLCIAVGIAATLPTISFAESPYFSLKDGDGFKRFSLSAGWLHAMPQGKPNGVNINTSVKKGDYAVGDVQLDTVTNAIANTKEGAAQKDKLLGVAKLGTTLGLIENGRLTSNMSGKANINSLESWNSADAGLKADNVDTLGIMANYFFTDNISLEFKAGIPPKVDIKGQGQINAPVLGIATPEGKLDTPIIGGIANSLINGIGGIPLDTQIPITNLAQSKKAASATAWLPAAELHYQFGKSGVNKFRPYIGVGVMYAHFTNVKLDSGINQDLVAAGHMVQNVLDGKAGAALEGKTSSADPSVKVKADDAWAPMATLGATYDFNDRWFGVGSVTYAPMSGDAKITVVNNNTGKELIRANTKIDIDPLITYVGVGYRF